jgi:hypothetical protein
MTVILRMEHYRWMPAAMAAATHAFVASSAMPLPPLPPLPPPLPPLLLFG